jgi:outer membrane lipoprotein-sorting protein
MKRHRMILLPALALLVGFTARASAQTADEIVEKHLTALGGREALGKLKSRAVTGTVTISSPAGDFSGPIESYFKAPNKSRTHMKVDLSSVGAGEVEIDQRFDGSTGFMLNTMQGNSEITGNQLDNLRNNVFPSSLLNYKAAGTKVEVLPKEKVDGKDAIILLITPKTGSPVKMSLDAESYLPVRTVTTIDMPQMGGAVEQTAEFSDYRDVDGVKVAFLLRLSNMAQSIAVRVAKVEHNTALDDAMFIR